MRNSEEKCLRDVGTCREWRQSEVTLWEREVGEFQGSDQT